MKQEDDQQVKNIFQSAVGMRPEERADFLDKACQGDKVLRQAVELLLDSNAAQNMKEPVGEEIVQEEFQDKATEAFSPVETKMQSARKVKQPIIDSGTKLINFKKTDELVGQTLDGRFLIKKDLTDSGADAGGIGLVYLAEDMKLMGKETVVKILKADSLENEDIARKFMHEKEALIRLDHPNIVRILDAGTLSDNNPFMVMEFIPGYSLRKAINKTGKLPFDFCAHIIKKVTDALSAAHAQKIIHRDIKPENIMLTPLKEGFDRVRLIDFGIARVEESELAPATTIERGIGTILYMAPEQFLGKIEQSPAIDIYAFALVAYEMMMGKKLFNPKSIIEMYQLQQQGLEARTDELLKELPEKVVEILFSALEFEPGKRPQNARKFGLELAAALMGETENDLAPAETRPSVTRETSENVPATEAAFGDFQNNQKNTEVHEKTGMNPGKLFAVAGVGLVLLAAIAGLGAFVFWKSSNIETAGKTNVGTAEAKNAKSVENLSARQIPYYLNVQKMRDGKPFEEPFRSAGREVFESGYKFQMVFESLPAGFLYLFYEESKSGVGQGTFNILFPTPSINEGMADMKEGQKIETFNNEFDREKGTEIMWMIWSKEKQPELEDIREFAFANEGKVSNEKKAKQLGEFIDKYKDSVTSAEKDAAKQQTVIKGTGDVLVYKIELEHR